MNVALRISFCDLSPVFKIRKLTDWYNKTSKDLLLFPKSRNILKLFDNSHVKALTCIYPEFDWHLFKFPVVPRTYWQEKTIRNYLDWLAKRLGIQQYSDWYKVSKEDFVENYGEVLLLSYGDSVYFLLKSIYKEYNFQGFFFSSKGSLTNLKSQYTYISDYISPSLGIESMQHWYLVKRSDVLKFPGSFGLLEEYNESHTNCLHTLYPHHFWYLWNFEVTPKGFWNNTKTVNLYLFWLMKQLNIDNDSDWDSISYNQIKKLKGSLLLQKCGGLKPFLKKYKPNLTNFQNQKKKSQLRLYKLIEKIFPTQIIIQDYKHPELLFKNSKKKMEIDVFLPSLFLGFEYQGEQHYESTDLIVNTKNQKYLDFEKSKFSKKEGIHIIYIPYWWDKKMPSLKILIENKRPDLRGKI